MKRIRCPPIHGPADPAAKAYAQAALDELLREAGAAPPPETWRKKGKRKGKRPR